MNDALKINKLDKIKPDIKIDLPSSKSYLNRALIVASIQNENQRTILTNVVNICDDVRDLIGILQQLGVKISIENNQKNCTKNVIIYGKNKKFNKSNNAIINCGLGGTTTRFMLGLSLLFDFDVEITATGKMLERPINSLINVIKLLGKNVEYLKNENCLPVKISGNITKNVEKIEIDCSKSSQFLTAILLVANNIEIKQILAKNVVSKTYINITKDILKQFGIDVEITEINNDLICNISKNRDEKFDDNVVEIESDWSSASYFLALEFLFNTKLNIAGLDKKTSQGDSKFIEILQQINEFKNKKSINKDDVLTIDMSTMPDASMTAMVVCAFQDFITKIVGLGTLKNKECDRLKAMHDELEKFGVKTEISSEYDAIIIYGNSNLTIAEDVKINTYNDHRIAMCFAVVGTKIGHIIIDNPKVVNKSFPSFWQELEKCYK